jgi:methylated-DNA-[protein]-cysteine S-methyltransferase
MNNTMSPGKYTMNYASPVGLLTIDSDYDGITGLWIENQKYFGGEPGGETPGMIPPVFEKTREWLDLYFSGKEPDFTIPLHAKGSAFREAVWEILRTIPYGSVLTYGEIAKRLEKASGKRVSAQAVGGAVGHNPISILIPCHRVVGTNGSLTGYAGGIGKKAWLLTLEGADMRHLFVPSRGTAL